MLNITNSSATLQLVTIGAFAAAALGGVTPVSEARLIFASASACSGSSGSTISMSNGDVAELNINRDVLAYGDYEDKFGSAG